MRMNRKLPCSLGAPGGGLAALTFAFLNACASDNPPGKSTNPGGAAAPSAANDSGAACALVTKEEVGEAFGLSVSAIEGWTANTGGLFYCRYKAVNRAQGLNTTYDPLDPFGVFAESVRMHEPVPGVGDAAAYDEKLKALWFTKGGKGMTVYGSFGGDSDPKEALIAVARKAAARL